MSYSPFPLISPRQTPVIIGFHSLESVDFELRLLSASTSASANYPAANVAILIPFGLAEPVTVVKMWVENGTAAAGNLDVGIFNTDGTVVVHAGSTAQSGVSTIQEFDITDTSLMPGRYYMGITSDTSGVTQKLMSTTLPIASVAAACGILQASQAPPLGNLSLATCAQTQIPNFGLSMRTAVL